MPEGEVAVYEGHEDLELQCSRSSEEDILAWYFLKDDVRQEIYHTNRLAGNTEPGYSVKVVNLLNHPLTILNVTEEFAGQYECIVAGSFGGSSGTIHVNIQQGMLHWLSHNFSEQ